MSKKPFKVQPDPEVGKTEVLYKGKEEYLSNIRDMFSKYKCSEIYPSFEQDFQHTFFIYETDDAVVQSLYSKCDDNLPRPKSSAGSGGWTISGRSIKWSIGGVITVFVLIFIYMLYTLVIEVVPKLQMGGG